MPERILIDQSNWKRKETFDFMNENFAIKFVDMNSIVNAGGILDYKKRKASEKKVSIYACMAFAIIKAINSVDEFRYVIEGDDVFQYDKINLRFCSLDKDNEVVFANTAKYENFNEFYENFVFLKEKAEKHQEEPEEVKANYVFLSTSPWMSTTNIILPYINQTNHALIFSKISEDGSVNVAIQAYHPFVDAYHIGLFYQGLQKNLDEFYTL